MFAAAWRVQDEEQEEQEDEVYQYPKLASGPVFAAIENILRW